MTQPQNANLILLRHGQSIWNLENRFTGWTDVDLTERGIREAQAAGQTLQSNGFEFDIAYTSVLKRAIHTLWLVLKNTDLMWIPVVRHWRLNERHYGTLQGLNKKKTIEIHGTEQIHIWRRSFSVSPPSLQDDDPRHPRFDRRYTALDPHLLPASESLADTTSRLLPFWQDRIAADLRAGKKVLVVLHGNSMRSLVKILDAISDNEISEVEIPTGLLIAYTMDQELNVNSKRILGR